MFSIPLSEWDGDVVKEAVVPNGKVSMGKASNALKRANRFPKTRSHRRSRYDWVAELRFVNGYVLMRNNFQPDVCSCVAGACLIVLAKQT